MAKMHLVHYELKVCDNRTNRRTVGAHVQKYLMAWTFPMSLPLLLLQSFSAVGIWFAIVLDDLFEFVRCAPALY